MKKLLIIALLVVGCDYAPTEHTHDNEHTHDTVKLVRYLHYSGNPDVEALPSYENCYYATQESWSTGGNYGICKNSINDTLYNPNWYDYRIHAVQTIMHIIESNEFLLIPFNVPDTIKADTLGYQTYDAYLSQCAFPQGYIITPLTDNTQNAFLLGYKYYDE